MTEHGKAIYNSIVQHPEDWVQEEYIFKNKKTDISIWTANIPFIDFSVYKPENVSWSWHDKFMIYLAVQKHGANLIIQKLKN